MDQSPTVQMFSNTMEAVVYCMFKLEPANEDLCVPIFDNADEPPEDEILLEELFSIERKLAHVLVNAPRSWIEKVAKMAPICSISQDPRFPFCRSQDSSSEHHRGSSSRIADESFERSKSTGLLAEDYDSKITVRFHPTQYADTGIYDYRRLSRFTNRVYKEQGRHDARMSRTRSDLSSISGIRLDAKNTEMRISDYDEVGRLPQVASPIHEGGHSLPTYIQRNRSQTNL